MHSTFLYLSHANVTKRSKTVSSSFLFFSTLVHTMVHVHKIFAFSITFIIEHWKWHLVWLALNTVVVDSYRWPLIIRRRRRRRRRTHTWHQLLSVICNLVIDRARCVFLSFQKCHRHCFGFWIGQEEEEEEVTVGGMCVCFFLVVCYPKVKAN